MSALVLRGALAGGIAGLASGFLGASPGGFLVAFITMLLPYSQHVAQGISLVAQAPPTSIGALAAYSGKRLKGSLLSVVMVSAGFVGGGPLGAFCARLCSESSLRWMFVGYLLILAVLSMRKKRTEVVEARGERPAYVLLLFIGIVAGVFSGLLGIGGGLAIVALSVLLLGQKQRDAQMMSLTISALPLTLPAAWVYVREGFPLPWMVIAGIIGGLTIGSWMGGLFANRLPEEKLKKGFVVLLLTMAVYMAVVAMWG